MKVEVERVPAGESPDPVFDEVNDRLRAAEAMTLEIDIKADLPTIDAVPAESNGTIHLETVPAGRGKHMVTATDGDGLILFSDELRPGSADAREKYIEALLKKHPEYNGKRDALDEKLIAIATAPAPKDEPLPEAEDRESLLRKYDALCSEELRGLPKGAIAAAERMLAAPNLLDLMLADAAAIGIVGERTLTSTLILVGTSRLLNEPLSGNVSGPSSSGKSFMIDRVSRMFPDCCVVRAHDWTANSLHYLAPGSLMHRFVVAGERSRVQDDERAEATRALREMISDGVLRKATVQKGADGKLATDVIEQFGPIAFVESTTLTRIFDEDANRFLLLATDESAKQTRAIVDSLATRAQGGTSNTAPVIVRQHALQLLLKRVSVAIPYADRLAAAAPTDRPQARRAIGFAFNMIRAVSLLHQFQREERNGAIVASTADYTIAWKLLGAPLGRALGGGIAPAVVHFGKRIEARFGADVFSSTDAAKGDSIVGSKSKVNEYLRTLEDCGTVELVEQFKGNKPAKWQLVGPIPEGGALWLPHPTTIDPAATTEAGEHASSN